MTATPGLSEILNQIIAQAGSSMQLANQLLTNTKNAAAGVKDGAARVASGSANAAVK